MITKSRFGQKSVFVRSKFIAFCLMLLLAAMPLSGWLIQQIVKADSSPQPLPFSQNWTNAGLITANDNWSGVPGIEGYLGQDITTGTGTDPQTLLTTSSVANDLDVIANQTNPNTLATGGVAEFDGIANPSIALNGSGTADAPYVLLYLNTTGQTSINVAYNVRDLDGSADDAIQRVALHYRVGNTGNFTNLPAGFVADATTANAATQVTPISVTLPAACENQPLVQLRVMTTNAVGNDEWVGIDDINITAGGGGGQPVLSINDVTQAEGQSGTSIMTFTVSLSQPAGVGGVTYNIATQDNTATDADNDYEPINLTGESIAEGQSSKQYNVIINGDATVEPNESFFVNVTSVTGATLGDGQGVGTISNDDFTLVPIRDIQGSGNVSPLNGQVVTTSGIVTGTKSNGFFIQDPTPDANVNTSEGIFVFTSSAPPAGAVIGNSVAVTGTVSDFIPAGEPNDPRISLTELGFVTNVSVLSTSNTLPAAITLTAADTTANGGLDQLEKYEGMRVRVNSLTVIAPTAGNITESSATATSTGVFYGVITGVARPFREPGIEIPNPVPSPVPSPNNIPRFDGNPERLRVDSDAQPGTTALNVTTGATITNLVGPLDYSFRTYTILPEAATTPTVSGLATATPVPQQTNRELTISTFNMQRFFDTVNDPDTSDVVLTTTAFNNRLNKVSLAIRNVMRTPDVIGVEEMENLTTLQAVATKVNDDAVAASQPNPMYQAYLVEGNDVGGIDVGFLVKSSRIAVVDVTQFNKTETYINPNNGQPELLNDRPPLVLRATAPSTNGGSPFAFTVIVNHLRSFSDAEDPVEGPRVRAKRKAQAESLATLIQTRQTANPAERIVVLGDMNAFQFNDGLVDSIGAIKGKPAPADQVVLASSDLVNPDLVSLVDLVPPDQRYSYTFDGNAQVLDHVLINQNMLRSLNRFHYARNNADFPLTYYGDPNRPERLSDHDPSVAYFSLGTRFRDSDFDGDGITDISVYRSGIWWIQSSLDGTLIGPSLGRNGSILTHTDYDGDGKTDLAVWDNAWDSGSFFILNSSNNTVRRESFGLVADQFGIVGDWDGDGKADLASYRTGFSAQPQSYFFFKGSLNNPNGNITYIPFGTVGDKPIRGDFDGDGKQDPAVFRPTDGTWHILQSSNNQYRVVQFGLNGDRCVADDYDGDGKTDIAVWRPSDRVWYIMNSSDNSVRYQQFGLSTDFPVPNHYDIDGKADIAVWRDGTWYILQSYNNSVKVVQFGQTGDNLVPAHNPQ